MQAMIPAGFSYNRKTGEYTDLYRTGTSDDMKQFAMRLFGIDKLIADQEFKNSIADRENQPG